MNYNYEKPGNFPLVWNDSLRSAFVSCPRAANWEYMEHFKFPGENTHLHAGKAWATALEAARLAYYGDGTAEKDAQAIGLMALMNAYGTHEPPSHGSAANKTLDRLVEAFSYYFLAFPLSTDPVQPHYAKNGKPMVEFNFALPIDATPGTGLFHPITNEPILYAGRADMVATYAGSLSIYDDKTTSQLGPQWGKQWLKRSQFSAYAWAAREYGIPINQIVVRGIAILKTTINHQQSIVVRAQYQIDEWHKQVIRDIKRAIECYNENYWDVNLADSCSSFGGCSFLEPCMSANTTPWLEGQFVRRIYNPITRTETVIPIIEEKS